MSTYVISKAFLPLEILWAQLLCNRGGVLRGCCTIEVQLLRNWGAVAAQLGRSCCIIGAQLLRNWGAVAVQMGISSCAVGMQLQGQGELREDSKASRQTNNTSLSTVLRSVSKDTGKEAGRRNDLRGSKERKTTIRKKCFLSDTDYTTGGRWKWNGYKKRVDNLIWPLLRDSSDVILNVRTSSEPIRSNVRKLSTRIA